MRYLYFSIIFALFASCATTLPTESPGGFVYTGYDLRKYADEGILITTTEPEGNFLAKGIITVELYPEVIESTVEIYNRLKRTGLVVQEGSKTYEYQRFFPTNSPNYVYYKVEITKTEDAIDEIVKTTIEWDADTIYQFRVENEAVNDNGLIKIVRKISGFAVKREATELKIINE